MTQHLMFTHELILDWRRLTPGEAGDRQIPRQYESFASPTPLFVRHSKTAEGEEREIPVTRPLFLPAEGAVNLTRNALIVLLGSQGSAKKPSPRDGDFWGPSRLNVYNQPADHSRRLRWRMPISNRNPELVEAPGPW